MATEKKTFADIIKDFEGKSYDDLLTLCKGSLNLIVRAFSKFSKDCEPGEMVLPFIFTTLGVDGELSSLEHQFLNDLFEADFDYEGAKKYALAHSDNEIVDLVDQLIDICDPETKAALLIFCMCFAAIDGTVSCQETAYLLKLFA